MDVNQNIELFKELVSCGNNIYTWCYDNEGQLLESNCPNETVLDTAFTIFGCKDRMLEKAKDRYPIALGTSIGLIWACAYEYKGNELQRCYAIGPICHSEIRINTAEFGFDQSNHIEVSLAWKNQLISLLDKLPVVQNIFFTQFALMLHYCLTGDKISASEFNYAQTYEIPDEQLKPDSRDRHKVWLFEKSMLDMVRNGDLNYKQALNNSILSSNGVPVKSVDALRQMKDSLIVFTSIVCRAAIDGGLSAELSYTLGDSYIQNIEDCNSLTDLAPLSHIMYEDFVRRVNKVKSNPKLSKPIQKCCDFIDMHLDSKVRASELADLVGYSEYYITRKFKEETGMYIVDYANQVKIQRAKSMLSNSELSIQEIADQLGFCSSSYFSQKFKELVNTSPLEFRENNH